jgi:isoleucyl-tRNA synthetase
MRTVMDLVFHRLTAWLAPILVFTAEDVWLSRFPSEDDSIHLHDFPATPAAWRDAALAEKWAQVRAARRVVTAALEVQRTAKVIGASLEAAPEVFVDAAQAPVLQGVDFEDVCITSALALTIGAAPEGAFTLPESPGIGVVFRLAEGSKCERCWKHLPDVGTHRHPGLCDRCDAAIG